VIHLKRCLHKAVQFGPFHAPRFEVVVGTDMTDAAVGDLYNWRCCSTAWR
jgi:hypothetical protein